MTTNLNTSSVALTDEESRELDNAAGQPEGENVQQQSHYHES